MAKFVDFITNLLTQNVKSVTIHNEGQGPRVLIEPQGDLKNILETFQSQKGGSNGTQKEQKEDT